MGRGALLGAHSLKTWCTRAAFQPGFAFLSETEQEKNTAGLTMVQVTGKCNTPVRNLHLFNTVHEQLGGDRHNRARFPTPTSV